MKRLLTPLLFLLMLAYGTGALAQKDSAKKASGLEVNQYLAGKKPAHLVHAAIGGGLVSGDWARLYGNFGQVTVGYTYLFPSRFSLGVEGSLLFGNRLKYDPVSILRDANQNVIGSDGNNAEISYGLTAYRTPTVCLGRFFSLGKRTRPYKPEHGIHVVLKGGALIHKTKLMDVTRTIALLDKTNRRGFDNLRAGPLVGLAVSYWYIAPTGRYSIFLTAEPFMAFTQSQRSYNYNLGKADMGKYFDQGILGQIGFGLLLFQLGEEQEFFYH